LANRAKILSTGFKVIPAGTCGVGELLSLQITVHSTIQRGVGGVDVCNTTAGPSVGDISLREI
jgi:hypothetical protein